MLKANTIDTIYNFNPVDNLKWDITALSGASFFHGIAWMRVLQTTYGFLPMCFAYSEAETLRSALPMMEVNSWITGRRGVSLPFTDECSPLCSDAAAFGKISGDVSRHAKARRWKYHEIRGGRSLLSGALASISFFGHTLALDPVKKSRFSRVGSSARRAVRKAEQSNLVVDISTDLAACRNFYSLLCKTRQRHGLPPQPLRFFETIHRYIISQDQGIVVLASIDGIPVAGAIFFHRGSSAIYKFGASDESFQHLRPNNLVMWRAIDWYSERGFTTLDFGRTSSHNEGLRRFKLSWGTSERTLEYFRYDHHESCFVSSRDATRGWHTLLFRMMPPALSQMIGAAAYKHMA